MTLKKLIISALLSVMLFGTGTAISQVHASADSGLVVVNHTHLSHEQAKKQNQNRIMNDVKKMLRRKHGQKSWFKDGLNHHELKARGWITRHESGDRWRVLSYGHVCVGYFQLNPRYLGYKHGHVNLNHKHQVKIADAYVKNRYGSWVHAKHFWQIHHRY